MTDELLILTLKGKGLKEAPVPVASAPFLSREWLEASIVKNGGTVFENGDVRIAVGHSFDCCVRVWVKRNGRYFMAYHTDDPEYFLVRYDRIIEAVQNPEYFFVVHKTEIFKSDGLTITPAPVFDYPFIDGVLTGSIKKLSRN